MGELQHQESLGDGLDPGTDQGQTLAGDISAKIADAESGPELTKPAMWLDCWRHPAAWHLWSQSRPAVDISDSHRKHFRLGRASCS
jgi:hypothetical protein